MNHATVEASLDVNGTRQTGPRRNRRREDNHRLRNVLFTLLISRLPLAQEDDGHDVMIRRIVAREVVSSVRKSEFPAN